MGLIQFILRIESFPEFSFQSFLALLFVLKGLSGIIRPIAPCAIEGDRVPDQMNNLASSLLSGAPNPVLGSTTRLALAAGADHLDPWISFCHGFILSGATSRRNHLGGPSRWNRLAAIIHKFGVSVDFLRKFRAESVFRCDYKASKLVEPNRDEARAPSGNSSARRGLYICVGAGSQGAVRWDTDGASVMRRAFVRDKTMQVHPDATRSFPNPGTDFEQVAAERLNLQVVPGSPAQVIPQAQD